MAVLEVGGRVLVVGTTDHQVSLLAELDPRSLESTDEEPPLTVPVVTGPTVVAAPSPEDHVSFDDHVDAAVRELHPAPFLQTVLQPAPPVAEEAAPQGALAGSVLSAQTWKQAVSAARGRR